VAIFDLDLFKRVNDACGHSVGDHVLRAAAKQLAGSVRSGDHVARLGGDEFGLLLENLSAEDAFAVIERIRESLHIDPAPECRYEITASAGFVLLPQGPADREAPNEEILYQTASRALQQAKSAGRNRTVGANVVL
jgi:diguanylate cyclase (GGDEF)-like protein